MHEQTRDHFVNWLRDAHAMERQAATMLNGQSKRLEHYPELRARVRQHLEETEAQSREIEALLKRYDTSNSAFKDFTAKASAAFSAIGEMMSGDEVMKGALMSYTFEHFEICSYRILIGAAETLGDQQAVTTLRSILRQEEAMAQWLSDHLDQLTRAFLAREAADMEAKR